MACFPLGAGGASAREGLPRQEQTQSEALTKQRDEDDAVDDQLKLDPAQG